MFRFYKRILYNQTYWFSTLHFLKEQDKNCSACSFEITISNLLIKSSFLISFLSFEQNCSFLLPIIIITITCFTRFYYLNLVNHFDMS